MTRITRLASAAFFGLVLLGLSVGTENAQAQAATLLCKAAHTPLDEEYANMLGRLPLQSEVDHYAQTVLKGVQVAFYEPYPTYSPYYFALYSGTACTGNGGRTNDTFDAGIPYQTGLIGPDGATDQAEWSKQSGDDGHTVIALYRTYFCKLPSASDLAKYISYYQSQKSDDVAGFDAEGAKALAANMKQTMISAGGHPCWDDIADNMNRVLGRAPVTTGCNYSASAAPNVNTQDPGYPGSVTSCYWLWMLANGVLGPNDIIHGIRSTQEAAKRNENAQCFANYATAGTYKPQFSPFSLNPLNSSGQIVGAQRGPHSAGEYVTQAYRLFLGRSPSCKDASYNLVSCSSATAKFNELSVELSQYTGTSGAVDPTAFLRNIADRITNSANSQNNASAYPQYATYGGYTEYKAYCVANP